MKKLLIGFVLMLGVSIVGASASFGYVLKEDINHYEVSKTEQLKKEALKKVYIDANIPIKVCATQGQPRIELESSSLGVFVAEPTYDMKVREEGDSTYISLSRVQSSSLGLFFGPGQEEATIYLAQQDMDKLSINTEGYYDRVKFELDHTNIKDVAIDVGFGDVDLSGNYEKINIKQESAGNVRIDSQSPAHVVLEGPYHVNLSGQFKEIEIYDQKGGTMRVDSQIPTNIQIMGRNYYTNGQEVVLNGKYNNIDVTTMGGTLRMDLISAPARINILGETDTVNLALPKDITGFKLIKREQVDEYRDEYSDIQDSNIYSEFQVLEKRFDQNNEIVTYGDSATKILVENTEGEIYIVEGR
ncbi:MAG: hypothetical protein ACRCTE_02515 [Cellulosilyticaceae bacterium]